jgi:hypothetical protein
MDLEIQRRENDLVVASFGRGIFILDDYTPLRSVTPALLDEEAHLFPVKKAWMYIESVPLGLPGKSMQGDNFFTAPNPPFGAVITYYLKDDLKSLKEKRHDAEGKAAKEEATEPPPYPSWDDLEREAREPEPAIILTVRDADGEVVRRLTGPAQAGINRVAWDLRFPHSEPVRLKPPAFVSPFSTPSQGPMALPGEYTITMEKRVDGVTTAIASARTVEAVPLGLGTLEARDKKALVDFERKVARLQRAVLGAVRATAEAQDRVDHLEKALMETPGADQELAGEIFALRNRLKDITEKLTGGGIRSKYNEATLPGIADRVERIVGSQWLSTSPPTKTNEEAYRYAGDAFSSLLPDLTALIERDLEGIEARLEKAGAPWTPGRVPRWSME